ncbi:MAG TPA: phospho-sugar mutase [Candidatus Saccharimonadales bacterium]|nr:phospho-sugar mutase [Candidatus Saccharimonadales bacterium]
MKPQTHSAPSRLHESLARVLGVILDINNPWWLAVPIVRAAAQRYGADMSTLFRVEGDRLVLEGGVLGEKRTLPPAHVYTLPWNAKTWNDLQGQGITAGVAVFNKALAIRSYDELRGYPAHAGYWDEHVYGPGGAADPKTGFACLYAVPLTLGVGKPKDVVAGVFKIEKRLNNSHPAFEEGDLAAFALVASDLEHILRRSQKGRQLMDEHLGPFLAGLPPIIHKELNRYLDVLARYEGELQAIATEIDPLRKHAVLEQLKQELPEVTGWIDTVSKDIVHSLGYQPEDIRRPFLTVLKGLRADPLESGLVQSSLVQGSLIQASLVQSLSDEGASSLLEKARAGFATLAMPQESKDAALANLQRWLDAPIFRDYRAQIEWLIESLQWNVLLDSFHRVLPFGTGGRRGPVGIGTNRFNPVTLKSSVQGHVAYLRECYPGEKLSVAVAYDVRAFNDLRGVYNRDVPNPLLGMTSRDFAHLAAGVYAANLVRVYMLPVDSSAYVSTPELSFTIRKLKTNGGLNISASHNHPDDNGGKFFGAHGGQEVPPDDQEMAERVESVDKIAWVSLAEAREAGLLQAIPPDLHEQYIDLNLAQSLDLNARDARIVFTPLHGTGDTTAGEVLRRAGFKVEPVPEQSRPDGSFPTVPFRAPNPEVPESMNAGVAVARAVGADLVICCDPDADRLGVSSRTGSGGYRFLNGNEIAVVIANYKLERLQELGRLSAHPLVIKTEVTTELLRAIAKHFGGTIIGNLLVGFKYHGNVLDQIEKTGHFRELTATLDDFVIAVEESHGILVTHELRDKDAAGAAILLAELTARQRALGRTLAGYLDQIHLQYGYYANVLTSMVMSGAVGFTGIQTIQSMLRKQPPSSIAGFKVLKTIDHQEPDGPPSTDREAKNILVFKLENGARVIIRPSGTEPKNKTYVEVPSAPLGAGADVEALNHKRAETDAIAQHIADDFVLQMLALIKIDLPAYALRISGLVPLDRRVAFVDDFIPRLEDHARALGERKTTPEKVSKWIDENLRTYGEDARGLVSNAINAYVQIERGKTGQLPADRASERLQCLDAIAAFFAPERQS